MTQNDTDSICEPWIPAQNTTQGEKIQGYSRLIRQIQSWPLPWIYTKASLILVSDSRSY